MNRDDWWTTPFPYKADVPTQQVEDAISWLNQRGYIEWQDWNKVFRGHTYRFDFKDDEISTMFKLIWV